MTTFVLPSQLGTAITFAGSGTIRPTPGIANVVALPIVSDWGPMGADLDELDTLLSFGDYELTYGDGDTDGRDAVLGAFIGAGIDGAPAAGGVIPYRMGTDDAARATRSFTNGTDPALQIDALYKGTRGERIEVVIEVDPADSNNHRLRILFDGVTVERYIYPKTDIAAGAAAINARPSKFVSATSLVTGTALSVNAGQALAGGDDGEVLTSAEWLDALAALEYAPFTILGAPGLTDGAVQASVKAWVATQAEAMRPVEAYMGGPSGETFDAAVTRTDGVRDIHVTSLGAGTFYDDFLGKQVSTAQLVGRVAGAAAGLGESESLTFLRFAGLHISGAPAIASDEYDDAAAVGLTVFRRTEADDADLMIAEGVTTFIDDTVEAMPLEIFSDSRQVRVLDLFLRRIKAYGDEKIVGHTTVRDETRAAVRNEGSAQLSDLLERDLILPGSTPEEQPFFNVIPPNSPELRNAILFEFGFLLAQTTKYMIGVGRLR